MNRSGTPTKSKTSRDISKFLEKGKAISAIREKQPRLLFGIDATASRQPTWDLASRTQVELFSAAHQIANIAVQLCFYRGFGEFTTSNWLSSHLELKDFMQRVGCEGGQTQIIRLLKHAIAEHNKLPIKALLFIGDACEENPNILFDLAGQCGLLHLPIFVFQEGHEKQASKVFHRLANLSGGVHAQFDQSSASMLSSLLGALSRYITGGEKALENSAQKSDKILLEQLKK